MAVPKFKQKCAICKKNWVVMFSHKQFPLCPSCHLKRLGEEIKDPAFKKLFDIPPKLYEQSYFLRTIKENYLRFGSLTDKQIAAFKKTAKDLKKGKTSPLPEAMD